MKPSQPDLFHVSRPVPAVPAVSLRHVMEPFDFLRDGDAAACIPQPGVVIPEECRLPTDDERWQPGSG